MDVKISGIIPLYFGQKPITHNTFSSVQSKYAQILREINKFSDDKLELLIATQVKKPDSETHAYLTHIDVDGNASDEYMYRGYKTIGTGEPYSYVFLRRFHNPTTIRMEGFAELAYFIIKYLDKFEIDPGVGLDAIPPHGKPQLWFVPNSGELFEGKDRPELMDKFESGSNQMLENFKKHGLNQLLK